MTIANRLYTVLPITFTLALSSVAHGQVTHRRPMAPAPSVNYGFDNNAGAGCRDYNCGTRCYDGHSGTDFPVPVGTAVVASADGVVIATNNSCANTGYVGNPCGGRCGNYVQLSHSDGSRSIYCHMQLDSITVARGQRVRCGDTMGRSASSGSSSGPHLHFGYRRSAAGASIDSYRGRCTTSPGAWTDQNAYPQSPAAICACVPSAEVCNNRDDDCDGRIDDGISRTCYSGPAGTAGRGICRSGIETCAAGRFGACAGEVLPRQETCNRLDDDCDGRVDDGVCEMDAGTPLDSSTGSSRDAALDARSNADVPRSDGADAGMLTDARNVPTQDGAVFEDLGPMTDDDDVSPDRIDGGCGCKVAARHRENHWSFAVLAAVALTTMRARRRV